MCCYLLQPKLPKPGVAGFLEQSIRIASPLITSHTASPDDPDVWRPPTPEDGAESSHTPQSYPVRCLVSATLICFCCNIPPSGKHELPVNIP